MQRSIVVFNLDEQQYALHLAAVERIVRVAEITPVPKAPAIVLGVINVQGQVIPVINIRKRFRLPDREMSLSDHLIIARTAKRAARANLPPHGGKFARTDSQLERGGQCPEPERDKVEEHDHEEKRSS
jgi:hypothetical protein